MSAEGARGDGIRRHEFDAVDGRAVAHWLEDRAGSSDFELERAVPENVRHVFYDTRDRRLLQAGLQLRTARVGEGHVGLLEPFRFGADGVHANRRPEPVRPVDGGRRLEIEDGRFDGDVGALIGARPLEALCAVDVERLRLLLSRGAGSRALVILDRVEIPLQDGPPAGVSRVRLRHAADETHWESLADAMRRSCGLREAECSLLEIVLLARGEQIPRPDEIGPERVRPGDPAADVASAVLRRQFRRMLRHEPGTRLGRDPEALHDMRVASRRMRAALRLFRKTLPGAVRDLEPEVRWVGRTLGEVRDLDVQLEELAAMQGELDEDDRRALDPIAQIFHARRRTARSEMLTALDGERFERFVKRAREVLRRVPEESPEAGARNARRHGSRVIRRAYRRVVKFGRRLGPESPDRDLHRLRLRGKRLRYALEFLEPLYGKDARRMIRRLVSLQDELGALQDSTVARGWLRELAGDPAAPLDATGRFVAGKLHERHAARALALRAKLPRSIERLTGKPWRKLRRALRAPGSRDERPSEARPQAGERATRQAKVRTIQRHDPARQR